MINQIKTMILVLGIFSSLSLTWPTEVVVVPTLMPIYAEADPGVYLKMYLYDIAERESRNNPTVVNRFGFMGKYQFSPRTLWGLGQQFKVTKEQFLGDETLQDSAMVAYLRRNYEILSDIIDEYDGRTYKGIQLTASGILAGAHLIGPYGVRYYFDRSFRVKRKGRWVRPALKDGNGTKVEDYFEQFSGYDLTNTLE